MNPQDYDRAMQLLQKDYHEHVVKLQEKFAYANAIARIGDTVRGYNGEEFEVLSRHVTTNIRSMLPEVVYGNVQEGYLQQTAVKEGVQ